VELAESFLYEPIAPSLALYLPFPRVESTHLHHLFLSCPSRLFPCATLARCFPLHLTSFLKSPRTHDPHMFVFFFCIVTICINRGPIVPHLNHSTLYRTQPLLFTIIALVRTERINRNVLPITTSLNSVLACDQRATSCRAANVGTKFVTRAKNHLLMNTYQHSLCSECHSDYVWLHIS